ncbi:MAG: DUF4166 domain-containing protein [Alphaproteobacteria bacterium]
MNTREWFGERFSDLHPLLQRLHTDGGRLQGQVDVLTGRGVGNFLGERLAARLGIPDNGRHDFSVEISHHGDGLHWDRCFGGASWMRSLFIPVGTIENGYWEERSGPVKLRLTVDIVEGGWYWRLLGARWLGMPVPTGLLPGTTAYKTIENDRYRFHVGFSIPAAGEILSYSGLLAAD